MKFIIISFLFIISAASTLKINLKATKNRVFNEVKLVAQLASSKPLKEGEICSDLFANKDKECAQGLLCTNKQPNGITLREKICVKPLVVVVKKVTPLKEGEICSDLFANKDKECAQGLLCTNKQPNGITLREKICAKPFVVVVKKK